MSFDEIKEEIFKCDKYKKLGSESHHGITRLEHTMRVSKQVYSVSKKLNLDYVSATRASLLHDFFLNEDFGEIKGLKKGIYHPAIAASNASDYFDLSEKEKDAIKTHMFPLNPKIPKTKEAWVLTIVDKEIAIYEYASYKFNFSRLLKPAYSKLTLMCIFMFNVMTMTNK